MRPLSEFPAAQRRAVRFVLSDIDDALTVDGCVPGAAVGAMERLREAGLGVILVTGRPAGWCDAIAYMWPVHSVVGENGAFYFHFDEGRKKMLRRYSKSAAERAVDRRRLEELEARILDAVPGAAVAADQAYREADLAIDYREDVPPLPRAEVDRIVKIFEAAGAHVKVSSIHVNGWFGDYDKLAMTRIMFGELLGRDLDAVRETVVFAGDPPNDASMFAYFPHSVGIANVSDFAGRLAAEPTWATEGRGGYGFAELAEALLEARRG